MPSPKRRPHLKYQSLALIPLSQAEYGLRIQRGQALRDALSQEIPHLTPRDILGYFAEVENRLTNLLILMPRPSSGQELSQKRKEWLLDWAFIHNETEKLLIKHPWLSPTPVTVLRRLTPQEKKELQDLKNQTLFGETPLDDFDEKLRPFFKSLDPTVPPNANELWEPLGDQVLGLQTLLRDLQRQVTQWTN